MNSTEPLISRRLTGKKHLSVTGALDLVNDASFIFDLKNKQETGFLFDLSKVDETSMLGILVIYKIIEYTSTHKCFSDPLINFDNPIIEALHKYGFYDLIKTYLEQSEKIEKEYKNLQVSVKDNFIIAPQALLRNSDFSERFLREEFLPRLQNYYKSNDKIISMIFLSLSEIILNFWEHAVADTKSILVANGNKSRIEIACADTGNGIISTLRPFLKNLSGQEILNSAMKKGVTSKKETFHMGYGLWILDELIRKTKGNLVIVTEGFIYSRFAEKTKTSVSGYWKGAIIYMSLPFQKPISLGELEDLKKFDHIKINWT